MSHDGTYFMGLYFIPPGWTYLPPEYLGGMKNIQGKTSYHQFLAYQPPALWVAAAGKKEGKSSLQHFI